MKRYINILFCCFLSIYLYAQPNVFLDEGFGDDGVKSFKIDIWSQNIAGIEFQSANKLIMAGSVYMTTAYSTTSFFLVRMNRDGEMDAEFGNNGIVETIPNVNEYYEINCNTMAIQADGKILSAGYGQMWDYKMLPLIYRYLPDGEIDSSFALNGLFSYDLDFGYKNSVIIKDIKVVEGDKILYLAQITYKDDPYETNGMQKLILGRLTNDGQIDYDFAIDGMRIFTFNETSKYQSPHSLDVLFDGKIFVSGECTSDHTMSLARFDANGVFDSGFGENGILILPSHRKLSCFKILPDNKMLAALRDSFQLLKLNADGSYDLAFGNSGILPVNQSSQMDIITTNILLQENGDLLLIGSSPKEDIGTEMSFSVLNSNGSQESWMCPEYRILNMNHESEYCSTSLYLGNGQLIMAGSRMFFPYGGSSEPPFHFSNVYKVKLDELINCKYYTGHQVELFPNPARDKLKIGTDLKIGSGLRLELFDISGRRILDLNQIMDEIDVSDLTGMFFYRVSDHKDILGEGKVVIE